MFHYRLNIKRSAPAHAARQSPGGRGAVHSAEQSSVIIPHHGRSVAPRTAASSLPAAGGEGGGKQEG